MKALIKLRPIFVADDSPGDQFLVKEALKRCGAKNQVFFFDNGQELVTILAAMASSASGFEKFPCMILLDINMPVKDGWEVLETIKADRKLKGIPIVILTNSLIQGDVDRSRQEGAALFITKPSKLDDLIEAIRSLREFWDEATERTLDRVEIGAPLAAGKDGAPRRPERLVIRSRAAMSNTSVVVVKMDGVLDVNTISGLEDTLQAMFEQNKYKIVLNLEKITYISSAGFGVLISVIKDVRRSHGDIKITNVHPEIYRTFELLELPGLFHILKTEQEAVESFF